MSRVITPRMGYMELIRHFPLSETITEAEELFDGDLTLSFKSAEQEIAHPTYEGCYAKGAVLGFKADEQLFIYLGLTYVSGYLNRVYPQAFFFGTDLDGERLEDFLIRIQDDKTLNYFNRRNVLEEPNKKSLLMTCMESHKARKKGLYEDLVSLPMQSTLEEFKRILDL